MNRTHIGRTHNGKGLYISQLDPVKEVHSTLGERANLKEYDNLFSNENLSKFSYDEFEDLTGILNLKTHEKPKDYQHVTLIGEDTQMQYLNKDTHFELTDILARSTPYDVQWRVAERFTNERDPSIIIAHQNWEELLVKTFMKCELNYKRVIKDLMRS